MMYIAQVALCHGKNEAWTEFYSKCPRREMEGEGEGEEEAGEGDAKSTK